MFLVRFNTLLGTQAYPSIKIDKLDHITNIDPRVFGAGTHTVDVIDMDTGEAVFTGGPEQARTCSKKSNDQQ
jgi:hypothetical protein